MVRRKGNRCAIFELKTCAIIELSPHASPLPSTGRLDAGCRRAEPCTAAGSVRATGPERHRFGRGARAERAACVSAPEDPVRVGVAGAAAPGTVGALPAHAELYRCQLRARATRARRSIGPDTGSRPGARTAGHGAALPSDDSPGLFRPGSGQDL